MARGMLSVANPITFPATISPVVDSNGKLTQIWEGLLRDLTKRAKAEAAPGRIQPFWLSAADIADATKFMQAGADIGVGVGDYLGWAKCDGNGGRPTANDVFLRWSLAGHDAAGASGGSDSSAHIHSIDVPNHGHADDLAVDPVPDHAHAAGSLTASVRLTGNTLYVEQSGAGFTADTKATDLTTAADTTAVATGATIYGTSAADGAHTPTLSGGVTDTNIAAFDSGAASVTDNRPSFKSWVPLMRV